MERAYVDVLQAWAVDDCTVRAYCDDGRVRQVDMRPFIEAGGVFEQLKNPEFFHTRISAMGRHDFLGCKRTFRPAYLHRYSPGNRL